VTRQLRVTVSVGEEMMPPGHLPHPEGGFEFDFHAHLRVANPSVFKVNGQF
jgi:hypothetical protein